MTGRFARWLREHPGLAGHLAGGPVTDVLDDADRITLRVADGPERVLAVRGLDRRGPEGADPDDDLRPPAGPDGALRIGLVAEPGVTSWAELAAAHPEAAGFARAEGLVVPDPPPALEEGWDAGVPSLHRLAEVMSAARESLTGRIGLRASAAGFLTPAFPHGPWLAPAAVLDGRPALTVLPAPEGAGVPLAGLTPAGAAAVMVKAFAERGVRLPISPGAFPARALAPPPPAFERYLGVGLRALSLARLGTGAGRIQLWPEHFDQAFTLGDVTCGVAPGDDADPRPYLYVLTPRPDGPLPDGAAWRTAPWSGAILPWDVLRAASPTCDDAAEGAVAFFRAGLATAQGG